MKKISSILFNIVALSVIPGIAGAAGTYYNGSGYQRYGNNNGGYYKNYSNSRGGYGQNYSKGYRTTKKVTKKTTKSAQKKEESTDKKQGWYLGADLEHQFANWKFEMKNAGSLLHYDNLNWNVIHGDLAYYFGNEIPMQIKAGASYGKQFGETKMIDDDISSGGMLVMSWTGENDQVVANQVGHALSTGTSKDGSQTGFYVSFGLPDFFKTSKVKLTPSVGFRYLKYELSTTKNYGLSIDTIESSDAHPYISCIYGYKGELQCDPFLLFYSSDGQVTITGRVEDSNGEISDAIQIPTNIPGFVVSGVGTGGTYYYEQSGTTHKYETSWMGPYLALDAEYAINKDNFVYGGIEIGLPIYKSTGDQPYRYDWNHPKSVEDSAGFGDAYHIGLNAGWSVAVGETTSLNLGFTYDYYSVSKANAKTFLNGDYYTELYDLYVNALENNVLTDYQRTMLEEEVANIEDYRASKWVLEDKGEIKSIYKSMGIRLGIDVKF